MVINDFYPRTLSDSILSWSQKPRKLPLLLEGARQVGKTALLTHFGQTHFPEVHYFNFERERPLHTIFQRDLDPRRILQELEVSINKAIDPSSDLVIFDEIQACGQALTSLKYFSEELPGANLACAGSLVGLYFGEGSFPVGSTERITLWPLSFDEFLDALGEAKLAEHLRQLIPTQTISPFIAEKLWENFLLYLVVGGMPAAVRAWKEAPSRLEKIRAVSTAQQAILKDYLADIAKHCGDENSLHIEAVLRSIPEQLARESDGSASKFQFKDVIEKKKSYKELRGPINWLEKAGLIHRVSVAEKALQPLSAYCKENRFKLYLFDVGILRSLAHFSPEVILSWGDNMYKGFVAENFALAELLASGWSRIYAWREGDSEVEFVLEAKGQVVPVEVKSGVNRRRRSLQIFQQKYEPRNSYVFAGKGFNAARGRSELPIFAVSCLCKLYDSMGERNETQ